MIENLIMTLFQDREIEGNSQNWKNWESKLTLTTCKYCVDMHGTIFPIKQNTDYLIPAHENGKCDIVPMRTKYVGTATELGLEGADAYLVYAGRLPEYYVTKKEARQLGWKSEKGNLDEILPDKMLGGNIYKNKEGKLPNANGRIWYEADFDYYGGYRNRRRIAYSNDGLIFVSYDHMQTFYEIIR